MVLCARPNSTTVQLIFALLLRTSLNHFQRKITLFNITNPLGSWEFMTLLDGDVLYIQRSFNTIFTLTPSPILDHAADTPCTCLVESLVFALYGLEFLLLFILE
ncbi:hypothetical protein BDR04DRAFT_216354 [Suillus decipiens]|nr:hypothetical protein BDR04DRAFT_216354 [Suillus decipiens]